MNYYKEFLLEEIVALEEGGIIPVLTKKVKEEVIEALSTDDELLEIINERVIGYVNHILYSY